MKLNVHFFTGTIILILSIVISCTQSNRNASGITEIYNQTDSLDRRQGTWRIYQDSILSGEGLYQDDQREGLWTFWYRNGQRKAEGHFVNGVKQGIWVEWYDDGDLMWKGLWEDGKRVIEYNSEEAQVEFVGQSSVDQKITKRDKYIVRIRIPNIPANQLYVEVKDGTVESTDAPDLYYIKTNTDSTLTLVVGYIPDPEFPDFRNLVAELTYLTE